MKILVLQENLQQALQHVVKAVPSRPQLPILSSILISSSPSGIVLSATDLYMGIRVEVLGQVLEEGSLVVPAKPLLESISSLSPGQIELETEGTELRIKAQRNALRVQGQLGDEYPEFPSTVGQELVLELDQLDKINTLVAFAVGQDPSRVILTALLFLFSENTMKVVGTDGFRLALLDLPAKKVHDLEKLLLPARALTEVCRIAHHQEVKEVSFFVSQELKQLSFRMQTTEMFVRLIDGEYPPFEKILPSSFLIETTWDGEEFAAQLKRALIFARESSNIIRLQLERTKLKIVAKSPNYGEYTGEMDLEGGPEEPQHIAFNGRYVLDFIANAKPARIWMGMNDSLKPAMLRVVDQPDFRYVVMPFRVND